MTRPLPQNNPPKLVPGDGGLVAQTRCYRLITPLFGGGADVQQADPITVVRATEVRGQLRFWWRATRGGQFGDDWTAMKRAEDALWGSTERASLVQVAVEVTARGKPRIIRRYDGTEISIGHPQSDYSYVAFPLNVNQQAHVIDGVAFMLRITFPQKYMADVVASLAAWEMFGGIGGRTRRGFGALQCLSVDDVPVPLPTANALALREWIQTLLDQQVVAGSWDANIPHLSHTTQFVAMPIQTSADTAWRTLFNLLKQFRHQRPQIPRKLGNGQTKPMPSRNHWPEPDAIRRMTGRRANYTDPQGNLHDHTHDVSNIDKFPRAAFGLPIQFEFKRADQRNGAPPGPPPAHGDPLGKNRLLGEDAHGTELDRLASPLIIRPVACGNGEQFGAIAVYLEGIDLPPKLTVEIQGPGGLTKRSVSAQLTASDAATIPDVVAKKPLLNHYATTTTDIIVGFLNYLRRNKGV